MTKLRDLTGERFGRLVVSCRSSDHVGATGRRRTMWICVCDCGTEKEIIGDLIKSGNTSSCGCLEAESRVRHGGASHPMYKTWDGMIGRCYRESHEAFKHYGGRGISVCDEWRDVPSSFFEWGRKNGWKKGLQIDRKDNDGNYSPDNCRVVTCKINQNNKRTNKLVDFDGERLTLTELADRHGIRVTTIRARLERGLFGLDLVAKSRKYTKLNGESRSVFP